MRVLHIVTSMNRGGLETMIMNYYRNIDRKKIQFDFLVHRYEKGAYDDDIEKLGGKIYRLPNLNPYSKNYLNKLDEFFRINKDKYKIIHCHLDCMSGIPLKYAKKYQIPIRIAHSHNSNQNKDAKYILKLIYKNNIHKYANYFFACSKSAGKWMFGKTDAKSIVIMNNAIDSIQYAYNFKKRISIRNSFSLHENSFVIGHVGRFNRQKNHEFLIDIFYQVCRKDNCARLLLVGDGELREAIYQKANNLNILDKIIFTGIRGDIPDLLQGMDVFLFPSLFEGLPVSLIEAQAAGLKCLVSNTISNQSFITTNIDVMSLSKSPELWADELLKYKNNYTREDMHEIIINAGFDIRENAKWLEKVYIQLEQHMEY